MESIVKSAWDRLQVYSPVHFIRGKHQDACFHYWIEQPILQALQQEEHVFTVADSGLIYDYLAWDSEFFGFPCYRIRLFWGNQAEQALRLFLQQLPSAPQRHLYMLIPSEDIFSLRIAQHIGMQLCETRLNYWQNIEQFNVSERFPVRHANEQDSQLLGEVARKMVNAYDRFHADAALSFKADDMLQTYAEQSVHGLADTVLVPDLAAPNNRAFLTARHGKKDWEPSEAAISKMVLSAVDSDTNKGWYRKLISEMSLHLQEQGAQFVYMNTQSANKAVLHVWEQTGYRFGSADYLFSMIF